MRTILLTSVLVLYCLTCIGQNLKALDEKYGFREAIFEMPFASFKNLTAVEENFFFSPSEDLTLGEYKLKSVLYQFIMVN